MGVEVFDWVGKEDFGCLESLGTHRLWAPPGVSHSSGLWWDLRTCISNNYQVILMLLVWVYTLRTTPPDFRRNIL